MIRCTASEKYTYLHTILIVGCGHMQRQQVAQRVDGTCTFDLLLCLTRS